MTDKQAGRKLESMLMQHDILAETSNRWEYIRILSDLLAEVDPRRFAKLQSQGIL